MQTKLMGADPALRLADDQWMVRCLLRKEQGWGFKATSA